MFPKHSSPVVGPKAYSSNVIQLNPAEKLAFYREIAADLPQEQAMLSQDNSHTVLMNLSNPVKLMGTQSTVCPTSPAQGFNVLVRRDADIKNGDSDGPMAIGDDLTMLGSFAVANNNAGSLQVNGTNVGLIVEGEVYWHQSTGNGIDVNQNTYAKLALSSTADAYNGGTLRLVEPGYSSSSTPRINVNTNQPTSTVFADVFSFTSAFSDLESYATQMSALASNNDFGTGPNGQMTLMNGQNVVNITGAQLSAYNSVNFTNQPSASRYLIINVDASGTFNWDVPNFIGSVSNASSQYILWNFYNCSVLNINNSIQLEGTLFAPFTYVCKFGSGNINGQVIAYHYYHAAGEVHYYLFAPCVDLTVPLSGPQAPNCTASAFQFQWTNNIDVTNLSGSYGIPVADYRLKDGGTTQISIALPSGFHTGPVDIDIDEAISYDGYTSRPNAGTQSNEQWKLVFLKNGVFQWETPYTGDLTDGIIEDEWAGSLGTTTLANGADEVIIVHYEDGTYGSGSSSSANSVVPSSFCINYLPPGGLCTGVSADGFRLYDLNGNNHVTLIDGGSYQLSNLPYPLNLEALASGSNIQRVDIDISGSYTGSTNWQTAYPYRYPSDYGQWVIGTGTYTVKEDVIVNGSVCDTKTITFTITGNNNQNGNCILLSNPSFEYGGSDWNFGSNTIWANSGYYVADGSQIIWIYKNNSYGSDASIYQDVSINPGGQSCTYTLDFFAGTHNPSLTHKVRLQFYDTNGALLSTESVEVDYDVSSYSIYSPLAPYTLSAVAPAGATTLRVEGYASGDYLKLDGLCLTKSCTTSCNGSITPYVTDASGWQQDSSITVCEGEYAGFGPQPTSGGWSWTGPNGFSSTNREVFFSNANLADAGTYVATYTDANSCTYTQTFILGVNPTPSITEEYQIDGGSYVQGTSVSVCENQDVRLNFVGASYQDWSFAWSGPNGFSRTNADPSNGNNDVLDISNIQRSQRGAYTVTYTDPSGCTGQASFQISVKENPLVTVRAEDPSCLGGDGSITFRFSDHSSRTNIEFSLDGGNTWPSSYNTPDNVDSLTIMGLTAGSYDLYVRWGNNDCPVDLNDLTLTYPGSCASLGDFVFYDDNRNGIQDNGEGGVANISVELYLCNSSTVLSTQLTDQNGAYLFTNLEPTQEYYVVFDSTTIPTGYVFTQGNVGLDEALDSDADPNGQTGCYNLIPGQQESRVDAGIALPVQRLLLTSLCSDDPDNVRRWRVRNPNNFDVGYTYQVYGTGQSGSGVAPSGDSYFTTTTVSGPNTTKLFWIDETGTQQEQTKASGGALCADGEAALGDFVFEDLDKDGIQDGNESGVQGVTVNLYSCADSSLIGSATTGANGEYLFDGLFPSRAYFISLDSTSFPVGFTFTIQDAGSDDEVDSDVNPLTGSSACVVLSPGDTNRTLDAGITASTCIINTGGIIGSDQASCGPFDPDPITSLQPAGPSPASQIVYEWRYSADSTIDLRYWAVKKNESGPTYDPSYLRFKVYFVRLARCKDDTTYYASNIVTLAVNRAPFARFGFPEGACALDDITFEATRKDNYLYEWSFPGSLDPAGSPTLPPTPANRKITTSYLNPGHYEVQLTVTDTTTGCISTAKDSIGLDNCNLCSNLTDGGTVDGNQASCSLPFDPIAFKETLAPSGGIGNITYQWFSSTDPTLPMMEWNKIPNTNSPTLDPDPVSLTTYYVRGAKRELCNSYFYTNIITVEIGENIQFQCQTVETDGDAFTFTLPGKGGSFGDQYRWVGGEGTMTTYYDGTATIKGIIENLNNLNMRWFVNITLNSRADYFQWARSGHPYAGQYIPTTVVSGVRHLSWNYYQLDSAQSYFVGQYYFEGDTLRCGNGYAQKGKGANTIDKSLSWSLVCDYGTARGDLTGCRRVCLPDLKVTAKVLLSGFIDGNTGQMRTALNSLGVLPTLQPYGPIFGYNGAESVANFPPEVVDWVLLELRKQDDISVIVERKAVLLLQDGTLIDPSTDKLPVLTADPKQDYFLVVRHRNHMGIMSAITEGTVLTSTVAYDFTVSAADFYTDAALNTVNPPAFQLPDGRWALIPGDIDITRNQLNNASDGYQIIVDQQAATVGYFLGDLNGDGVPNASDQYILWSLFLNQYGHLPLGR